MKTSKHRDDVPRFAELEPEYEILRELGRGGTAVVYLARERELGRKVAIKVIRTTYIEDAEATARLVREAHMVGGLQHPHIVVLHGTRRLRDRSLALIMQYVQGRTLKSELRACGPLPFEQVKRVLTELGGALDYAHRHRIVHRDIKPENVYLDDENGIARLSDFGIARMWDAHSSLTLPGSAIGTPTYMSPEQIDGDALDGRTDLYSLGLVGYEMVTGEPPWHGENLFGIIYKQKHEALPPMDGIRRDLPPALRYAIEGALHKDPGDRWADAAAFLAALSGDGAAPAAAAPVEDEAAPEPGAVRKPLHKRPRHALPDSPTVRFRPSDAALIDAAGIASAATSSPESEATSSAEPAATSPAEPEATSPAEPAAPHPVQPAAMPAGAPTAESGGRAQVIAALMISRTRRRYLAAAAVASLLVAGAAATIAMTRRAANANGRAVASAAEATAPPAAAVPAAGAAGAVANATVVSGEAQRGLAGDTLASPLAIRVTDAGGAPVAGATVRFAVAAGIGVVVPELALTDARGVASAVWVAQQPGEHMVEASIAEADGSPHIFRATVLPRPPATLAATTATDLRGTPGDRVPLEVAVYDERGNAVAGVAVRFDVRSGDGRVTTATSATDGEGVARTDWVLGPGTTQQASASVPDVPADPVTFTAEVRPQPLAVHSTLAVGGTHTCFLDGEGAAVCWGGNDSGQLGDGSTTRRGAAVQVDAPEPLAILSAGVSHTCGVGVSGSVFCWGSNAAGQLGTGTSSARLAPARVRLDGALTSIATGMSHSCGLDAAGRLYCWGENEHGQLGDGTTADHATPVRAGGNRTFRSVALGWAHTCALATDGTAYCWGRNTSGEVGDGESADRASPVAVRGGHEFTAIAAGSSHTCALRRDGTILCWGENAHGQLGNATTVDSRLPVAVLSDTPYGALTVGGVHTCALSRSGVAECWGRNSYGQLGNGSTRDHSRPTGVAGGHRFTALHASGAHTCGSVAGGGRMCWGFNLEGQLGDGTRTNQPRPVAVVRPW